jgi:hypothetical protein
MLKKFNQKILLIILITLLAAFLRLFQLDANPPSLNWDEVSHGYNAYSILTTGKDEWGQWFPLANFRAYGDYPLPVNLYLTIPSILIFGLNTFAIRFPSALLGSLSVLATYFLVKKAFENEALALLSALLLALSPWHLFPARAVFQSNIATFFLISAVAFFFAGIKGRPLFTTFGFIMLGISAYSYHNTRIIAPFFLLGILWLYRRELLTLWQKYNIFPGLKPRVFTSRGRCFTTSIHPPVNIGGLLEVFNKRIFILNLAIILLFFLPLTSILFSPQARARASWVSILDQGAINTINEARGKSTLPGFLPRLLYNKATYVLVNGSKNVLYYFSPQFLFFQGGTQYQRSIPGRGVMHPIELPFFYLGLILLFSLAFKKNKAAQFLLLWLIVAPLPSALTQGTGHVIRASTLLPIPQILVALGVLKVADFVAKLSKEFYFSFLAIFVAFLFFFSAVFLKTYFGEYRIKYSWAWQYGYKDVASFIEKNYDTYQRFIITKKYGEPHEFLLFYLKWPPEKYQNDPNLIRFFRSNWYWVDRFDKFYFVNDWEIPKEESASWRMESGGLVAIEGRTALVTSPGNHPPGWKFLETINFLNGKPAFEIYER